MKLERAQEIYSDYEEGSLSPAMKLALEQHFDADPAGKQDFDDFSRLFGLLSESTADDVEVPHGFRAKIMERVSLEDSKRPAQGVGFAAALRNMFAQPRRREAAGVVAAVLAVAIVGSVVLKPAPKGTSDLPPAVSSMGAGLTLPDNVDTVIQGVDTKMGANNTPQHDFRVHLPMNIPSATVNAYDISSPDQILDPAVRERDATPVLTAQALTNDEAMTIPLVVPHAVPAGSTLNILVEWTTPGSVTPGAQIVFTPINPNDGVTPSTAPPSNGNFFDSLQTIASAYHATVIADATSAPTTTVQAWSPGDPVDIALKTVATSAGYSVASLDSGTYLVYRKPAQ